jgi:hypothetical protein
MEIVRRKEENSTATLQGSNSGRLLQCYRDRRGRLSFSLVFVFLLLYHRRCGLKGFLTGFIAGYVDFFAVLRDECLYGYIGAFVPVSAGLND